MEPIITKVRDLKNGQLLATLPRNKGLSKGDYIIVSKITFPITPEQLIANKIEEEQPNIIKELEILKKQVA